MLFSAKDSSLRRSRNRLHSLACRLPEEILIAIFSHCYYPESFASSSSATDGSSYIFRDGELRVKVVSAVCTRWRDAALSSATLRASVHICPDPVTGTFTDEIIKRVSDRLNSSGNAPVYVHVNLPCSIDPHTGTQDSPDARILALIRSNLQRTYGLTLEATSVDSILPLPLEQCPILRMLNIRARGGDLDVLHLFSAAGRTGNSIDKEEDVLPEVPLEHLSVHLPALSRTAVMMIDASAAKMPEDSAFILSSSYPYPPNFRSRLITVSFKHLGDECGPLDIISNSAATLRGIQWSEHVPCLPSPPSRGALHTNRVIYLPVLKTLKLDGYASLTPFTPPVPISEEDLWLKQNSSYNGESLCPCLEDVCLSPKGLQRPRRNSIFISVFPPASSAPIPGERFFCTVAQRLLAHGLFASSSTAPSTTVSSVSAASDLEDFLERSRLPSLKRFVLNGSAASLLPPPHSPSGAYPSTTNTRAAGVPRRAGSPVTTTVLSDFLSRHVSLGFDSSAKGKDDTRLEEVEVPYLIMPALAEALLRVGALDTEEKTPPLRLTFTFRNAYMPDDARTVAFLRTLLNPHSPSSSSRQVELVLSRDSGLWPHRYRALEIESRGRVMLHMDFKAYASMRHGQD